MIPKTLTLVMVVSLAAFNGCKFDRGIAGSGVRKTESRDLKTFNAIDATGAYQIDITCQKPLSVEVEADDNILPLIKTEVRDGVLYVSNNQRYHSAKSALLRISVPELASVNSNGAGEIKIVDAAGENLRIASTGAASVDASGKTKSLTISSTGAGDIDSSKLQAEKVKVDARGAANVEVYASEQLDVDVAGAGSVTYGGNPKVVNKHVSGIGSVSPKSQ